ncbi:hypothetical protein [Micromonospora globbae]|uniref:hypothetical protein n=1 Tax=Micromonospora globbae TaxID=1894969 RepID=UPI0034138620
MNGINSRPNTWRFSNSSNSTITTRARLSTPSASANCSLKSSSCRLRGAARNREEYLQYIAKLRPSNNFALRESKVRIPGDVALIHGRATYATIADGAEQEALCTDVYQKPEGTGVGVSARAIAPAA